MAVLSGSLVTSVIVLLMGTISMVECQGKGCDDKLSNCDAFSESYCDSSHSWAKVNCAKYCGLCDDTVKQGCGPVKCGDDQTMDNVTCQCVENTLGCGPIKCGADQSMDNVTCQCTPCSAPCPQDSVRGIDCSCECKNGLICKDYDCVCPHKNCTSDEVLDQATCQCVENTLGCGPIKCADDQLMDNLTCQCTPCSAPCPQDSVRGIDCSCECKNGLIYKDYDCVCPHKNCTSKEVLDQVTCQCVDKPCSRQCPDKSFLKKSDCTCRCNRGLVAKKGVCVEPTFWESLKGLFQDIVDAGGFKATVTVKENGK